MEVLRLLAKQHLVSVKGAAAELDLDVGESWIVVEAKEVLTSTNMYLGDHNSRYPSRLLARVMPVEIHGGSND